MSKIARVIIFIVSLSDCKLWLPSTFRACCPNVEDHFTWVSSREYAHRIDYVGLDKLFAVPSQRASPVYDDHSVPR